MSSSRKARRWLTILVIVGVVLLGTVPAWAQVTNPVTNTDTGETFATIQAAINDANTLNGHTITVADGTYTITSAIGVNKGVTITGDVGNPENVLVQYAAPQSTNNGFEITANNVIVQGIKAINGKRGFYLNGVTGCKVSNCIVSACADQGIYVRNCPATSEATRVEVTGNIASDCGNTWGSACIQTYVSPYTYIYNNMINATEDKGINIIRSGATGTADRVQVIGNTISETKWPGIQVIGSPYTYVYDNTLTKCNYYGADGTGDWDYASIHVQDDIGLTYSNHTIIDSNTVSDGINGIQLWSDSCTVTNNTIYDMGLTYADTKTTTDGAYYNSAILYGDMYDVNMPTSATISNNNIYDNYWGLFVISTYTGTVDASSNWWGTNDPAVIAAVVDPAKVDFSPILDSGTDGDPGTPGWQPDLSSLTVHTLGQQIGTTGRIQEGINLVTSSIVNVAAGTYQEQVGINKGLDLLGSPGAVVLAPTGISGPTIRIAADGTTVSGLEISNTGNSGETEGIFVGTPSGYADVSGQSIEISNNVIDGVNTSSLYMSADGIHAKSYDSGDGIDGLNILNNLITNISQPYWGANGIMLQANVNNVLIEGNTISNIDGLWVWGIVLTPSNLEAGFPTNVTIKNNVFEGLIGNTYPSVAVGVDAAVSGHEPDASQVVVRFNSLAGADIGAANLDPNAILDAALNWWGDASGASGDGSGSGSAVTPNVIFSPWLGVDPDGDPTTPGVQLVSPVLFIVDDIGPAPADGYLGAAIGAANDLAGSDTIEVRSGMYADDATITDPVTIESQEGCPPTTFIDGNLVLGSAGIQLGSLRHGFTIRGNLRVGAGINAAQIHVNWNNIEGQVTNTDGIGALDATYNFWGADGPLDNIAGQVHYYPYLPVEVCAVIQYMDDYGLNPNQAIVMARKVLKHVNPKDILAAFGLVNMCGMSMDDALAMIREYGRVKVQRALRLAHGDCAKFYTQLVGYGVGGGAGGGLLDKQIAGGGGAIEGVTLEASYTQGDTIHVAFTLTDPITGDVVTDAVATLSVVRVDPTELAFWGMIPYDSVSGQYQLDYATSGLTPGYYDLYIGTSDGQTKQLRVEIVAP